MLNIIVNGNVVNQEPDGVKDLTERIYYSAELGGYLTEVSGSVAFYGNEYDYLRGLLDSQICDSVSLIIADTESITPIFNGKMFLTDMIWYPDRSMVEAEVLDDGYLSAIDGNKEIEAEINVNKSKNGITITSLALSSLQFWDETRMTNYNNRSGMRVGDALEFLVDFMTDGQVGFVSDFFDTNATTHPQYFDMICTGLTMRDGTASYPRISFDSLFKDLQKIYNLAFAVERTADGVRMRVEPKNYFYKLELGVSFENVFNPKQTIRRDSFYSKMTMGSAQTSSSHDFYPNIPFSGVGKESYHLGGECNINTQLPLELSTLITDTNIIQDILPSGAGLDNYDDDVFLIRFDSLNSSYYAMTQKPGSATDYYYNEPYHNYRVAKRWFDQIPESIFSFLGGGNDQAFATQSVNPKNYVAIGSGVGDRFLLCDDDSTGPNEDPSGNYTTGNLNFTIPNSFTGLGTFTCNGQAGYYTAPINGMYNVTARFYLISGAFFNPMGLIRLDSSSNVVEFPWTTMPQNIYGPDIGGFYVEHNYTFYMDASDIVAFVFANDINVYIQSATFKVLDPLGGEWQTNDSKDVRLIETAFDYDVDQNDWNDIVDDPFKTFYTTFQSGSVSGWISEIERNRLTGRSSVRLLSKP